MKLSSLECGREGIVTRIIKTQNNIRYQLISLGIVPNTKIKMIRKAPLGGNSEYHVRGYSIGLHKEAADMIEIAYA